MARVGGRQKGTPNKIDGDIKRMVIHALHYAGGVDYLTAQAHKHPVAFLGLVGRVLPLQVTGTGTNGAVIYEVRLGEPLPPPPDVITPAIEAQLDESGPLTITIDVDGDDRE